MSPKSPWHVNSDNQTDTDNQKKKLIIWKNKVNVNKQEAQGALTISFGKFHSAQWFIFDVHGAGLHQFCPTMSGFRVSEQEKSHTILKLACLKLPFWTGSYPDPALYRRHCITETCSK